MYGRDTVKVNKSKLDVIFVFTVFLLFTASLLIVIVTFAKIYSDSGKRINERFDGSAAMTMLVQKIRAYDYTGGTEVIESENGNVLRLNEEIDGTPYYTYIYYLDGHLRELFNSADTDFIPEYGMPVIAAESFKIEQDTRGSYIISITVGGNTVTRHVSLRSLTGGADNG